MYWKFFIILRIFSSRGKSTLQGQYNKLQLSGASTTLHLPVLSPTVLSIVFQEARIRMRYLHH